ncbi:zinc-dependent alcohol dehydrogenase family protein [Herbiconiux sp. CPCC 205763]|uniref:Zinc-dependent alcohol dehydrogenase family protein n=1 Tax=Herbiconiux aconitum TaxID=2970913 RepID=A0ABT2GL37_9MICO|nr:zinc-dependent alcohol dehydrogenase family protein [Herbiconiux aconitum]MCS5716939.1 zinc-dependent alcohol dehydrogenase family protein [Herbiconiux aconitum]
MKAIVYDRPGSFTLAEIPTPRPGARDVLLRVIVAGVCGTDLHLHDGEFGPSYPLIPGHEVVGEVVERGSEVTQVEVGDRVTFDNTAACGHCDECRRARPAFCRYIIAQGVNAPGGFAEFVVTSGDRCFVVNDLDPEVAVFAEPIACVVHGLDVLALKPGADVLLFGAGPTGLVLAELLAKSGAGMLTVAAPTAAKLAFAAEHGADRTVQVRREGGFADDLLALTSGRGFDVVIDATGALGVLEHAIPLTRTGGTVFVYGMTAEAAMLPIAPYEVFRRELTIKGSFAQQFSFDRALEALRNGRVDTAGMVTHRFTLEEYAEALAAVADSSCIKAVIRPGGVS